MVHKETPSETPLRDAILVLEELEQLQNRIAKEALLTKHKLNPALRQIFRLALGSDRYLVQPSVNLVATSAISPKDSWFQFLELLEKLRDQQWSGAEALKHTNSFLILCRPLLLKWYCRILNHDLRVGITQLTIDNIWGAGFLTGATKPKKVRLHARVDPPSFLDIFLADQIKFPIVVQASIPGEWVGIVCYPADGELHFFARSGRRRRQLEQNEDFCTQVLALCDRLNHVHATARPLFLEGKFLARHWNQTAKWLNSKRKPQEFLDNVRLILYDYAPLTAYEKGTDQRAWNARNLLLLGAAGMLYPTNQIIHASPNVAVLGGDRAFDLPQLEYDFSRRMDAGYRSIILRAQTAPQDFTKAVGIAELTPDTDYEGHLVEVIPGTQEAFGRAPKKELDTIQTAMQEAGKVHDDGTFLVCRTEHKKELLKIIDKQLTTNRTKARFIVIGNEVGYRYAPTLGALLVELENGVQVKVGGGFPLRGSQDMRLQLWQKREQLLGKTVQFQALMDRSGQPLSSFSRFRRLI